MRRVLVVVFQLAAGIAVAVCLWWGLSMLTRHSEQDKLPAGWAVIRPPDEVCCLAADDEHVWAGGKDGLSVVDRATGIIVSAPGGGSSFSRVWALERDRDGVMWVGHDGGLASWDGSVWATWPEATGAPEGRITALCETRQRGLLAGGEHGVVAFDGDRFETIAIPADLALPSIDTILEDRRGVLWLGSSAPTAGGLLSLDDGHWTRYDVGAHLPHPAVNLVTETRSGDLWFATGFANRGGAARLSGGTWTALGTADGLAGPKVRSIFEDDSGRLWFGSEYDGLAIRESDGAWTYHREACREVKAVLEDENGVLWLGTDDGLTRIAPSAS